MVNNMENDSVHSFKESMNRRNNSILEINPFHLMYLLEIALNYVDWPHRHLQCLFQFTASHTISLRTVLLFMLPSIRRYSKGSLSFTLFLPQACLQSSSLRYSASYCHTYTVRTRFRANTLIRT